MLEELSISNLGLIEKLNIAFGSNFNVITGETGVGKSMLLGALNFLIGARSNTDLIRFGESQATVTGVFRLKGNLLTRFQEDYGEYLQEDTIYLRRVLTREGRSKSYIGDIPVTLNVLREVASSLVEVHGQHEHQSLMKKEVQIRLLDRLGHSEDLFKDYVSKLKAVREKKKQLDNYGFHEKKRQEEAEYLDYQIKEYEEVDPKKHELTHLEKDIKFASNYQKMSGLLNKADELLGNDNGINSQIFNLQKTLSQLENYDNSYADLNKSLSNITDQLQEIANGVAAKMQMDSFSATDVDRMIQRAERLKKIFQKHDIVSGEEEEFLKKLKAKYAELKRESEAPEKLAAEIQAEAQKIFRLGEKLSETRKKVAGTMEKAIEKELKDLGMPDSKIQVSVVRKILQADGLFAESASLGLDEIAFMFLPNPGAPYMPLSEIASGGELARTMLSVAKVLGDADETDLLIFDEIDANIGGRLGIEIGTKISQLSQNHQVICVTHLPQIAAFAQRQYKIAKTVHEGNTKTAITEIDGEVRLKELAEMIQGKNYSDVALKQAEDLLLKAKSAVQSR